MDFFNYVVINFECRKLYAALSFGNFTNLSFSSENTTSLLFYCKDVI